MSNGQKIAWTLAKLAQHILYKLGYHGTKELWIVGMEVLGEQLSSRSPPFAVGNDSERPIPQNSTSDRLEKMSVPVFGG